MGGSRSPAAGPLCRPCSPEAGRDIERLQDEDPPRGRPPGDHRPLLRTASSPSLTPRRKCSGILLQVRESVKACTSVRARVSVKARRTGGVTLFEAIASAGEQPVVHGAASCARIRHAIRTGGAPAASCARPSRWRRTMTAADIFAPDFKDAPYWWEAAPPSKATVASPPNRADVAIVGAGYCGLSAALELRRHGVDVLVVDAARIGHAASSLNGGMVAGNLKLGHAELARAFGPERATALLEESARCLPFLEELLEREAIACHYRRGGRFVGAHCPSAYAALVDRL